MFSPGHAGVCHFWLPSQLPLSVSMHRCWVWVTIVGRLCWRFIQMNNHWLMITSTPQITGKAQLGWARNRTNETDCFFFPSVVIHNTRFFTQLSLKKFILTFEIYLNVFSLILLIKNNVIMYIGCKRHSVRELRLWNTYLNGTLLFPMICCTIANE